ncbi:MAG: cysteine hydrolase [Ruminococcaceae bacterium]|nr:cysteine hydrolase [Oscillospiraceae bacterium]
MKVLVVVDMQNDFIDGALGSPEAIGIVEKVKKKLEGFEGEVLFTQDNHGEDYLATQEGKKLPVPHCIRNTKGWEICGALQPYVKNCITKETFGSVVLPECLFDYFGEEPDEIELVGLCTDICVISNAMILKAAFPEAVVAVDSSCCAGVSPESHQNALSAMAAVQIEIR